MRRSTSICWVLVVSCGFALACGRGREVAVEEVAAPAAEAAEPEVAAGALGDDLAEVPEGWPEDIELPEDFRIVATFIEPSEHGDRLIVNGETTASASEIHAYFEEAFAGWEFLGSSPMGDTVPGAWKKGNRRVSTTAFDGVEPTTVAITVTD